MASRPDRRLILGLSPLLALCSLLPLAAGLTGTLISTFSNDKQALADLIAWNGLTRSLWLSLSTGAVSTLLAFALAMLITAAFAGTPAFGWARHALSPILALPHAAAALGLAFLIAPSGWIARAISPWATGWTQPPDLLILNDPHGFSLTLGLVVKETPFLLLMALAALPQTDMPRRMTLAASLGYGRIAAFALTVLPALARQLRLPVHAVLAYGITSVDMGLVLGPTLPPPLAVQVLTWARDPGLVQQSTAAAGALALVVLVAGSILACEAMARLASAALAEAAALGPRLQGLDRPAIAAARTLTVTLALGLFAGLAGLALWSVAGPWPFPNLLPDRITPAPWASAGPDLAHAAVNSLQAGAISTGLALALALVLLALDRSGTKGMTLTLAIYLPLLAPQVAVLPGMVSAAIRLGGGQGLSSVVIGHLAFVLPYVLLSLSGPWAAWDSRIATTAAALGASPARIFWTLRLPMMLPALLTAAAVGFAVSVGQYLPSLLLSGGRLPTLTTEALALSSGSNRRLIGTFAVLQMALPMLGFLLATTLPRLIFARRRGMGASA